MFTDPARWLRWVAAVGLAVMVVGGGVSTPAYAHNQLSSSTPADGAVLDEAPAVVTLDFLDDLVPANTTVVVTGPDAAPAAAGSATFDGSVVTLPLQASYAGQYIVEYEVLASDGHLGTGELSFELTTQAAPTPPPAAQSTPPPAVESAPPTAPAAGPAGDAAAEPTGSTSWWPWLAVAAAGVVLAGLAAALLRRRARPG